MSYKDFPGFMTHLCVTSTQVTHLTAVRRSVGVFLLGTAITAASSSHMGNHQRPAMEALESPSNQWPPLSPYSSHKVLKSLLFGTDYASYERKAMIIYCASTKCPNNLER